MFLLVNLDRFVAKVNVQIRVTNGSYELAGDTDLTSKYCTFIDWQQSHHIVVHHQIANDHK
ncbi:MAG: hypothetical protein ACJAUY_001627 [Cognaticolwellia sp.]